MTTQMTKRNPKRSSGSYSNIPLFFPDRPYGREPRNAEEMLFLKHRRMLCDRMPGLINAIGQVLCKTAKQQFPGYDPAQYQKNVERIIAKRNKTMEDDCGMNNTNYTAALTVEPEEITAATEIAESPEFLASQAEAIDCHILSDEKARNMERAATVREEFNRLVLLDEDFCDSATKMLELTEELQADAALAKHINHDLLAGDLETYLLDALCGLAQVEDFLPDHIVFKANLYKGFIDEKGRNSFFSEVLNIRQAEFFEFLPQIG